MELLGVAFLAWAQAVDRSQESGTTEQSEQNEFSERQYLNVSSTYGMRSGPLLAKCVPKQDCIVVPPPSNIMEVKKKNTYYRGQNRPVIKYKSKL